jgi:hypothetical protein
VVPLIEKELPVICNAEIVTTELRAFVRTRGRLALPPTVTWPNDRVDGLAVTASLSTPVPPVCTVRLGLDALLVNLIVAGVHPVFAGVKLMLTSTL